MTVLVSSEGIILGADTQTTIIIKKKDKSGEDIFTPVNFFRNSQKIFNISIKSKKIIGLSQYGLANPGGKPLSTHIFSIRELLKKKEASKLNTIELISNIIVEYFEQFGHEQTLGLGFYISGFDEIENAAIPCVHNIFFGKNKEGKFIVENNQVRRISSIQDYGLSWAGEGNWIISKLLKLSDPEQKIPKTAIPYHLFSLKDGIELTEYLINTVIGFERFQSRFPTCGGEVRIATLTPREFCFINQKATDLLI